MSLDTTIADSLRAHPDLLAPYTRDDGTQGHWVDAPLDEVVAIIAAALDPATSYAQRLADRGIAEMQARVAGYDGSHLNNAPGWWSAEQWNTRFPVGTPVFAWPGMLDHVPLVTRTRTPAWDLASGEAVVSVDGHAGGIVLHHIQLRPDVKASCPQLGRLRCTRKDDHDANAVGGHTYEAPDSPDAHDVSEQAAEDTR